MIRTYFLFQIYLLAFPSFSLASDPVHGCRVKSAVLKKHGSLLNNGGCVITRGEGKDLKFLLVYTGSSKKGWGFPGGKPASREIDVKIDSKTGKPYSMTTFEAAKNIPFDYQEPAVCTAYRETREETSVEVVVGNLISNSDSFAAFFCLALDPKALLKPLQSEDPAEVEKIGWFTLEEMKAPGFLRFDSNLPIAEAASESLID